jgi:hypothetical protein
MVGNRFRHGPRPLTVADERRSLLHGRPAGRKPKLSGSPGRPPEIVQVVGLENQVGGLCLAFADRAASDNPPQQVTSAVTRRSGQRGPQDEGVLIVAGEG